MELILLALLVLIVLFWYETLRLREYVIIRCKQVCKDTRLQLLDQTVALVSLSVRMAANNVPQIYRKYQFEISANGVDRYPGYVAVLGKRIISISYAGPDGGNTFHQLYDQNVH